MKIDELPLEGKIDEIRGLMTAVAIIGPMAIRELYDLQAENSRLRAAIDKVPHQELLEIRKWMIEVIESNLSAESK